MILDFEQAVQFMRAQGSITLAEWVGLDDTSREVLSLAGSFVAAEKAATVAKAMENPAAADALPSSLAQAIAAATRRKEAAEQ